MVLRTYGSSIEQRDRWADYSCRIVLYRMVGFTYGGVWYYLVLLFIYEY